MGDVFDLDAVAEEANGGPGPFPFTFGGEQFELPGVADVRAVALVGENNPLGAMRLILGAEQWERLCNIDKLLTTAACWALLTAWGKHLRSSLGESSASTGSSSSTAKRSRPTSRPTTKSA